MKIIDNAHVLDNILLAWLITTIVFSLVNIFIIAIRYEKKYMGEIKLKETEQTKGDKVEQTPIVGSEVMGTNLKSKTSTSSAEQELDSFLLGDLEYRDSVPGTQCGKFVNAILMLAYHQNRM